MWISKHNGMAKDSVGWAFTPQRMMAITLTHFAGWAAKTARQVARAQRSARRSIVQGFLFLMCRREEGHQKSVTTPTCQEWAVQQPNGGLPDKGASLRGGFIQNREGWNNDVQ
jgi:hypothetical protein